MAEETKKGRTMAEERGHTGGRKSQGAYESFTPHEVEVLKKLVRERDLAEKSPRSHQPVAQPTSVRPDEGLWAALRDWGHIHHMTNTEALNQAIEALLSRD